MRYESTNNVLNCNLKPHLLSIVVLGSYFSDDRFHINIRRSLLFFYLSYSPRDAVYDRRYNVCMLRFCCCFEELSQETLHNMVTRTCTSSYLSLSGVYDTLLLLNVVSLSPTTRSIGFVSLHGGLFLTQCFILHRFRMVKVSTDICMCNFLLISTAKIATMCHFCSLRWSYIIFCSN